MKLGIRTVLAAALVAGLAAVVPSPPATADHLESLVGPAEPARSFPADFVPLLPVDSQSAATATTPAWKDPRVGGWGGGPEVCPAGHAARTPVVFVHGNTYDAAFWRATDTPDGTTTNVRSAFLGAGYCPGELWAISYTGGMGYTTSNDINVGEVGDFVKAVAAYTGAPQVDVVSHSLGVTIVRRALQSDPAVAVSVRRLVAIAGANHGTTSCRGSGTAHVSHVCEETEPGSAWLDDLNAGGELVPGVDHLVIYDGSGAADNFFLGPDAASPRLAGACNHAMPFTLHLPLARGAAAVATYRAWLRDGMLPACTPA